MSLLATTQGLIERTYRTATGVKDVDRYVVGDTGYRRMARRHHVVRTVDDDAMDSPPQDDLPPGPVILIRRAGYGTALAIYFPNALIRRLEQQPPTSRLDEHNVDDFADFVEEVDHFVAITHGLNMGQEISLLELEMRANVTKALVLSHFLGRLSGREKLTPSERLWVRYHLFEKRQFCDGELPVRRRYQDARRFAVRFLDRLDRLPTSCRVSELRRWNTLPGPVKIRDLATA